MEREPRQQIDRPTMIIKQFLADPHILDRLVRHEEDSFILQKSKQAINKLERGDESSRAAQKLIEIAKHPQSETKLTKGAIILLENIPEKKVPSRIRHQIRIFSVGPIKSSPEIENRRKKILELRQTHPEFTHKQIAKELECSESAIARDIWTMKSNGTEIPAWKKATPADVIARREQIKRILTNNPNLPNREVARLLGCDPVTIKDDLRLMKKKGDSLAVHRPEKYKYPEVIARREQIKTLIIDNPAISYKELAQEVGCSIHAVKSDLLFLRKQDETIPSNPNRSSRNQVAKRKRQIKKLIIEHPELTNKQIAEKIGCTTKDVRNDVSYMKKKGELLPPLKSKE